MRRDLVLRYMRDQGYIRQHEYLEDIQDPLPTQEDLTPPQERTEAPYFTSWVRQQVVDRFGPFKAFSGDLEITTSLDLDMQVAAENAINQLLPPDSGLPSASLVAIDNKTGEVRAMVGGSDYMERPFNLATQGQRQPGSTFKPFTLVAALESGISPDNVYSSTPKEFPVPGTNGREAFLVRNYSDSYSGSTSLANATTTSDNSVYAEVGVQVGTKKIARVAKRMGIRTPISTNLAMTLGGLREGVTPLDMAHAYQTFATGGKRMWNDQLGAPERGPIGIHLVRDGKGRIIRDNRRSLRTKQVIDPAAAQTASSILQTVVSYGTGTGAQLDDSIVAGKTGTTENYGDAWFVGWNEEMTVAVWVGYPDNLEPMLTSYNGEPVAGGTYPTDIWHNFMVEAMGLLDQRRLEADALKRGGDPEDVSTTPDTDTYETPDAAPSPDSSTADAGGTVDTGVEDATDGDVGGDTGGGGTETPAAPPVEETPAAPPVEETPAAPPVEETPAAPPAETPAAPPADTGGGAVEGGGAAAPTG
jgi:penicillin-binding protein 1A